MMHDGTVVDPPAPLPSIAEETAEENVADSAAAAIPVDISTAAATQAWTSIVAAPVPTTCTTNRLCRIRNALFQGMQSGEMVPLPQLLHGLRPDDLRTAPTAALETMRQSIGAAFLGKGDPKWMQFYIMTLMRDVDVMEEAVLDVDLSEAHEIIHRVSLGVMQSKSVVGPALRNPNGVLLPLWAVVTIGMVVFVGLLLMVVFFAVLLQDLLKFKAMTQTAVTV